MRFAVRPFCDSMPCLPCRHDRRSMPTPSTRSFSHYEEVPPHLSERAIKEVRETRGVTAHHHE